jgi:hypothetical protein
LAAGHDLCDRLRRTPAERQIGYRALFRDVLDAGFFDALRAATNRGWARESPGCRFAHPGYACYRFVMRDAAPATAVVGRLDRRSSKRRSLRLDADACDYRVARSSRAMTPVDGAR